MAQCLCVMFWWMEYGLYGTNTLFQNWSLEKKRSGLKCESMTINYNFYFKVSKLHFLIDSNGLLISMPRLLEDFQGRITKSYSNIGNWYYDHQINNILFIQSNIGKLVVSSDQLQLDWIIRFDLMQEMIIAITLTIHMYTSFNYLLNQR